MPKRKLSKPRENKKVKWSDSYLSLILGALVVIVSVVLIFVFVRNNNYDKINTSESTSQLPTSNVPQSGKTYIVKNGDTLWSISESAYKSGYNWVDIAKENKIVNGNILIVGTQLKLPDVEPKIVTAVVEISDIDQKSITGESYKVVEGDHLWGISVRAYGDGYKWPEIARLNSIPNPDLIYAGSTLKLPR